MSICRQTAKTDIAQAQKFKITSFIIDNSICSEQFLEEYLDNPENLTKLVLNPFSKGNNIYIDSKNTWNHTTYLWICFDHLWFMEGKEEERWIFSESRRKVREGRFCKHRRANNKNNRGNTDSKQTKITQHFFSSKNTSTESKNRQAMPGFISKSLHFSSHTFIFISKVKTSEKAASLRSTPH